MKRRINVSRFLRPDRRTAALFLAVVGLTTTACVKPEAPEVAINKIEANLVFGVKPPPEPVTETAVGRPAVEDVVTKIIVPDFEEQEELELPPPRNPTFSSLPTLEEKKASDCEPAPLTAAPEVPTDVNITGDVPTGTYRFKREGSVTQSGTKRDLARSFERRLVRNVAKTSPTLYTFESVQPILGSSDVLVSRFRVNTNPVVANPTAGVGFVGGPRVGEPERGIALVAQEQRSSTGVLRSSFLPTNGLLMLPLPVTSGERYETVAVDPKTGQTIVQNATVTRRSRIDACGELIDGWLVEATRTVTEGEGRPPSEFRFSYIVATQYGGIIINERTQLGDARNGADLNFTQGQLRPDPLPTGA